MTTLSTPRGHQALATSAVFTTIATFIAAVRIYTRAFLVKQMGADDYVIIISLAFSWIFFGVFAGEVFHGMGEHYVLIPAETYKTQMIVRSIPAEHPQHNAVTLTCFSYSYSGLQFLYIKQASSAQRCQSFSNTNEFSPHHACVEHAGYSSDF